MLTDLGPATVKSKQGGFGGLLAAWQLHHCLGKRVLLSASLLPAATARIDGRAAEHLLGILLCPSPGHQGRPSLRISPGNNRNNLIQLRGVFI